MYKSNYHPIFVSVYLFFIFGAVSANLQRVNFWVVEFQPQNSGYKIVRLLSIFYLGLCANFSCPQIMALVPLSPLQDSPGFLAHQGKLPVHILSLSSYFLLFIPLLFSFPSTSSSSGCHPPSACLKYTTF